MTDRKADGAPPRLPSAEPASFVSASDHSVVQAAEAAVRRMKWSEYEEPELLELRLAGRAVLGVRIAIAAWAISVVVAAAVLRSAIADGNVSTAAVSWVGLAGPFVASGSAAAGWWWTDRATQNVHRLEARFPSRIRCVSAWVSPLIWFVVLSATLLRLDPTEPVDVRQAIVGLIFVAAMWRPYSLVRRILKSLIRIDSDLAVASGYLLDVALFGLLWARLAGLPERLGPSDEGPAGILLGLGAVAAIAAVGNVGVWYLLVRDVSRAVEHRRVAMRTRHGHRQLRLVGIDPLDPHTRVAMIMIAQEEHRAALEPDGAAETDDQASSPPRPESSPYARSRDHVGEREPSAAEGSKVPVEAEEPADVVLSEEVEVPVEAVAQEEVEVPVDVEEPADVEEVEEPVEAVAPVDAEEPPDVEEPVEAEEPPDVEEPVEAEEPADVEEPVEAEEPADVVVSGVVDVESSEEDEATMEVVARVEVDAPLEAGQTGLRDPLGRIAARMRTDHERIDLVGEEPTGAADEGRQRVDDAVRDRLAARSASGAGAASQDRLDQLLGRLGAESAPGDGGSILDRLERFGIAPGGTAIPDDGTGRADDEPVEAPDLMIDRLYSLELARYVLVLAIIACAGALAWFVTRAADVGELVGGEIAPTALDRLEVARLAAVRTLAVALALVPLWCGVAARWANRVDLDVPGSVRCAALTVVSGAFVGVGFVADPASNVMLFTTFGCVGAALWSVPVMIEIERRSGRDTTIPSLIPLALGFAVVIVWAGRLLRPVSATDSPEAMSFFGGLLALVMAIAAVVTALASGDLVEAIKLSPAAPRRRRGSSVDVS